MPTDGRLLASSYADQAQNTRVGSSMKNDQVSKILVQGYQDTPFAHGVSQNFSITGIFGPIPRPDHVMPGRFEFGTSTTPYTCIQ